MIDTAALSRFGDGFEGEVVVPGSVGYDAARRVWNGTIDRRPAIVARCESVDDVIRSIRFGRDRDLPIAVRSGGHSVGGFSTCDDGIVIDVSRIHGARVDPAARVARVRGGSLLSELDEAAQAHGLVCPVGVVGHTGLAGLSLGGGMGRLQRRLGLTVDNFLAAELVTADGEVLRVSEDDHPDLFWGIRGAGPNFGIVTEFELRLHPLDATVTNGYLAFDDEHRRQVAEVVRGFLSTAPDEVMLGMTFGSATAELVGPLAGRPFLAVGTTHSGAHAEAEAALAPLLGPLRAVGPVEDLVQVRDYLELQGMADEDMAWGKRFYMKGGFLGELSEGFVDAALQVVTEPPSPGCSITLWAMGGAIARTAEDATAFAGRSAGFWLGVEAEWDDVAVDEEHVAWVRDTMAALQPFTVANHYVNDMVERGDEVVRSVYGPEKYERLVRLKRTYDPDNVFRLNQNVRP